MYFWYYNRDTRRRVMKCVKIVDKRKFEVLEEKETLLTLIKLMTPYKVKYIY